MRGGKLLEGRKTCFPAQGDCAVLARADSNPCWGPEIIIK